MEESRYRKCAYFIFSTPSKSHSCYHHSWRKSRDWWDDEWQRVSPTLQNTMNLLSLYARELNIRPVIMTDSEVILRVATSLHFSILPQAEVNKYGLPILRSLMIETRRLFQAKQYIYINSDILLNPGIFSVCQYFDEYLNGSNVCVNELFDVVSSGQQCLQHSKSPYQPEFLLNRVIDAKFLHVARHSSNVSCDCSLFCVD